MMEEVIDVTDVCTELVLSNSEVVGILDLISLKPQKVKCNIFKQKYLLTLLVWQKHQSSAASASAPLFFLQNSDSDFSAQIFLLQLQSSGELGQRLD